MNTDKIVPISLIVQQLGVKDAASHLLAGINGSWILNALHKELEDEAFCVKLVNWYVSEQGDEAPQVMLEDLAEAKRQRQLL